MKYQRIKYLFSRSALQELRNHFLQALGVLWLLIEIGSFFFDTLKDYKGNFFWVFLIGAALWTVKQSLPPMKYSKKSRASNVEIEIKVGDLFKEPGNIAFGCSECFDTEPEKVIGSRSLMAQLLNNSFEGDFSQLNNAIGESLNLDDITGTTDPRKTFGKNIRYKVGTIAVIETNQRKIFLTAFSTTNNDRTSTMTKEDLWTSLCNLWAAVNRNGHKDPVAIPVLGAGLGGFQASRISLIQLLLLSFAIATREKIVTRKLTLMIRDEDYDPIEMSEAIQLINTLEF